MAAADHDGDVDALPTSITSDYVLAITNRRPDEMLLAWPILTAQPTGYAA